MKKSNQVSKMKSKGILYPLYFLIVCLVFAMFQSCEDDDEIADLPPAKETLSPEVFLKWNNMLQKAYTFTPDKGFPPPIISRVFAIYHVTMHDALNSVEQRYETYASTTFDSTADPNAAMIQAVYDVFLQIGIKEGPSRASVDSLYQATLGAIESGTAKDNGLALGKAVAASVLNARASDGPFLLPMYPAKPSGLKPGEYRYLPFNNFGLAYALAGFHLIKPFAIKSADAYPVIEPYQINSPAYTADYNEVKSEGRKVSLEKLSDKKYLGIFWAENSSRGWNEVARKVYAKKSNQATIPNKLDGIETARLFALLHMAIADAYISVFDSKMKHYYWRPISAIQEGDNDGNPDTAGDPGWESQLTTPPIGEYPSAHAMTGAAAGEVLIQQFGNDVTFSINSGYISGTREFNSIKDAILENSLSRIYIGYHFRKAVEVGEETGYDIGSYVFEHALKKK